MTKKYLLLHSKCTMGETEVHTIKWIVCSSNLIDSSTIVQLNWTQPNDTNISVGYTQSIIWQSIYLHCPHNVIEVETYSYKLKKICKKLNPSNMPQWIEIAQFTPPRHYSTITIHIHIPKEKRTFVTLPNLGTMLNDPNYSDAAIRSCDGAILKIHRCILAASSDVFKAHLRYSSEPIIESEFEKIVLKELLNFIYSGIHAVNIGSVAGKLFVAADFYHLNDLKSYCEYALYRQLTVDNVLDTLMLANLYSAVGLKNLALDFLDTYAMDVFTKDAWNKFKEPELLKVLYESKKSIIEQLT